jgi:hypothetical protein
MIKKLWKGIIFHCSESKFGDVDTIRSWHVNGNGWRDIGYNAVILNGYSKNIRDYDKEKDGIIEVGRGLDLDKYVDSGEVGAHTKGFNSEYIGICLIGMGMKTFTLPQIKTALNFVKFFRSVNPKLDVKGHYEMPDNGGKTCPNMDMDLFRIVCNNLQNHESYEVYYNLLKGETK